MDKLELRARARATARASGLFEIGPDTPHETRKRPARSQQRRSRSPGRAAADRYDRRGAGARGVQADGRARIHRAGSGCFRQVAGVVRHRPRLDVENPLPTAWLRDRGGLPTCCWMPKRCCRSQCCGSRLVMARARLRVVRRLRASIRTGKCHRSDAAQCERSRRQPRADRLSRRAALRHRGRFGLHLPDPPCAHAAAGSAFRVAVARASGRRIRSRPIRSPAIGC